MVTVLVILSLLGWLVGIVLLTQATYGVGVLAAACLCAILARMAQSGEQHRELLRALASRAGNATPVNQATPSRPGAWVCAACRYENGAGLFDCPHCGTARPTDTR